MPLTWQFFYWAGAVPTFCKLQYDVAVLEQHRYRSRYSNTSSCDPLEMRKHIFEKLYLEAIPNVFMSMGWPIVVANWGVQRMSS